MNGPVFSQPLTANAQQQNNLCSSKTKQLQAPPFKTDHIHMQWLDMCGMDFSGSVRNLGWFGSVKPRLAADLVQFITSNALMCN